MSARSTFENLEDYIRHFILKSDSDVSMLYILGNKTDKEIREVSKDEAEAFAESHGFQYFEVSAKENKGIDDIFNKALEFVC